MTPEPTTASMSPSSSACSPNELELSTSSVGTFTWGGKRKLDLDESFTGRLTGQVPETEIAVCIICFSGWSRQPKFLVFLDISFWGTEVVRLYHCWACWTHKAPVTVQRMWFLFAGWWNNNGKHRFCSEFTHMLPLRHLFSAWFCAPKHGFLREPWQTKMDVFEKSERNCKTQSGPERRYFHFRDEYF